MPDDRRRGRKTSEEHATRTRREPLFPLEADDIPMSARPGPPAPLREVLGDEDLPTLASTSPRRKATDAQRLPSAKQQPAQQPPPPRGEPEAPVTIRERNNPPRGQLYLTPPGELADQYTASLRAAQSRLELAEQDLSQAERYGPRPYLGPDSYAAPFAPPAMSLNRGTVLVIIAVVSLLVIITLGRGGASSGISRWLPPFLGGTGGTERSLVFGGSARPAGDYALRVRPSISAQQIDRILEAYGSPATGTGQIWYSLGEQYGIDPAFGVAFFIHESGAGTAQAWAGLKPDGSTTHNVGNIICAGYATCYGRFRDYPSWTEGIEDWYRLIDIEYLKGRGHETVADIIPVYAPSVENDVQGYINVVQKLVDQWRTQGTP